MDSFNKTNLQNIKEIFEEKAGVSLRSKHRRHSFIMTIAVVAVMVCCLTMTAFAISLFSSLEGDDLVISATYEGNGIVLVQIENRSDKNLSFQQELKLMLWSTSEEIVPVSNNIVFSGNEVDAHAKGIITIDISKAYDIAMLEQPLVDDYYYFILTNNNFAFGQDWMCPVDFAEAIMTPREDPTPITPMEADSALIAKIMEELKPYFESYTTNRTEGRELSAQYLSLCQQLLDQIDGKIVPSVSPMELTIIDDNTDVVFDPSVPSDMQLQLTGLHRRTTDGYDKIIGASEGESALVLSAYLPQRKGDIDGGVDVPLLYVFIYERNAIQSLQDYVFIRGQLMTFEQMEQYKIYEDGKYICYDASGLFYSDLRRYVESMVSQRSDVYFDEEVWERVQNIYNYYKENLGTLLGYRDVSRSDISVKEDQGNSYEEMPTTSRNPEEFQTEMCLDNPNNPVAEQNYSVGEPNWND